MDADDLDNLIADSLGGVQTALDSDKRPAAEAAATGDAVRELRQGPKDGANGAANDELFAGLVKTLQDESFKKTVSAALGDTSGAASGAAAQSAASDVNVEEYLQGFLQSFEKAVGSDPAFDKDITQLMTGMLSKELICPPLQQISDQLEPWLKNQTSLSAGDRSRYESQLSLYRRILDVYKRTSEPLPDRERDEVQKLLTELHGLGQPPEEVMKQIAPKESEEGEESFEDFMKSMGLDSNLGAAEQDLLKKLSEDPEELTKAMKEMAEGLPEDGCKQQ
eukprot:TRINITY_DN73415_c0_g1_i1.p1 TRINITY_DN73415_c0_g1~~TRINITY_DN73415_c0_g1_i1.p1  ORF type:complete len:279 (-),score=84.35 TRINITY_DN73415_c0_g1_i1:33-869(-)